MDPNWQDKGLDLYQVLHNQGMQYEILHMGMRDLRHADTVPATDWLGNPPPASSASKRRKPVGNTLPDLLINADVKAEGGEGDEEEQLRFAPVVDAAEALIQQNATSAHLSTWLVLYFLLASDTLRDHVCRGTPANVAHAYFEGFETRMSRHVCGSICYTPKGADKRAKSGKVLQSAISPIEAVASEWLLLDSIIERLARTT